MSIFYRERPSLVRKIAEALKLVPEAPWIEETIDNLLQYCRIRDQEIIKKIVRDVTETLRERITC